MAFDYSKLRGRIVEKFGSNSKFATAMGWSERTTSLKINSKVTWTQNDIMKAVALLGLSDSDIQEYFFRQNIKDV